MRKAICWRDQPARAISSRYCRSAPPRQSRPPDAVSIIGLPDDADDASIKGANVGKAVLADYRNRHGWEDLRVDQVWEQYRGGVTALALEWDDGGGDTLGSDQESGRKVGTGDTVEHVLSVAQMAFEPGCSDAERARWWVMGRAVPPEEVQERYQLVALELARR